MTGACIGGYAAATTHACQRSTACASFALFVLTGITAAYGSISASFRSGPDPAVHAMAVWDGGTSPDNYEKKIQSLGTTLTSSTNSLFAYDGPHLVCESRASVEVTADPQPADKAALSFSVQASVDTSQIDTSKGGGFARVDFQILVNLATDAYISGNFTRNSSTNRGGIRFLHSTGQPVFFSENGGSVLRAGTYLIDVYLFSNTVDLMPRSQVASSSFNFSIVPPPPPGSPVTTLPPPNAQPTPTSDESDTFVYFDAMPTNATEFNPYEYDGNQITRGHPWGIYKNYASRVVGNLYVDGSNSFRTEWYDIFDAAFLNQDYVNLTGTYLSSGGYFETPPEWWKTRSDLWFSDARTIYNVNTSNFTISTTGVETHDGYPAVMGALGLDASGGTVEISASYSVVGNMTWAYASGFMLRIDVDERGAVITYNLPPSGFHQTISTFEMGATLPKGSYYFGIVANPFDGPSGVVPSHPWFVGGAGGLSLRIARPAPEPPKPVPQLTRAFRSGGKFTLEWTDAFNRVVHVQRRASLSSGSWDIVGSNVSTKVFTDTNPPTGSAFYRLLVP